MIEKVLGSGLGICCTSGKLDCVCRDVVDWEGKVDGGGTCISAGGARQNSSTEKVLAVANLAASIDSGGTQSLLILVYALGSMALWLFGVGTTVEAGEREPGDGPLPIAGDEAYGALSEDEAPEEDGY